MGLYKVIFLGLTVAGPEEEVRLLGGLQKKFNLSPEKAESLLQRVPIVVKKSFSKEETERYVKAFQEIGGRVRVEEEPITEGLEDSQRPVPEPAPQPERKPYMGEMITCPQCGFQQPEADECVKCGIVISKFRQYQEMARSFKDKVREISVEDKVTPPWESGEGFVSVFIETTKEALFSPTKFFKKISGGEGYWAPLIYALISGIIGQGMAILWLWLFMAQIIPMDRLPFQYNISILQMIVPLPFQLALYVLIGSGILHLCLMIVGGNKNGFRTTFRALSYSFSGYLFGIIPFIGIPIGAIYALILIIFGVREGHGISTGRAVLAVFLPTIVAVGLGILAVIFITLFFGSMGFFGGMRA
ncbi:MAG: YIP1 family protein [Thermodesulfobacteriota bacterium]